MISIVIPAYNAGAFINEAVDSALAQEVKKELLLVDDASTDSSVELVIRHLCACYAGCGEETEAVCEAGCAEPDFGADDEILSVQFVWAGKCGDTPVRIYRNRENRGVAETRNVGVKLAQGEYIALLDADDRWAPGKLAHQLSLLRETGACLCNTARLLIREDGSSTGHVIQTPERISLSMLKKTNYINCSSVLVRRDVLLRYPMRHGGDAHEDYLTWLMLLQEFDYVVGIDEPYLLYRLSAQGKSRNKCKAAQMTYRTYRYAGYGRLRSLWMMLPYMLHGVMKHL